MVKKNCIALIPARSGSKTIPKKNIKPLGGHPLIAYSIAVAKASPSIDRVIVSTDSEEIAEVAREYGAEVPFLRPLEISQDDTLDFPVFEHAQQWISQHTPSETPHAWVHLRPTSPFRSLQHIEEGISLLFKHGEASSVRAVCVPFQTPYKMWTIKKDGFMNSLGCELGLEGEPYNQPRQALPSVYWQTGYFDAVRSNTLTHLKSMTGQKVLPLFTHPSDIIDIDTQEDWNRAENQIKEGLISIKKLGFNFEESKK